MRNEPIEALPRSRLLSRSRDLTRGSSDTAGNTETTGLSLLGRGVEARSPGNQQPFRLLRISGLVRRRIVRSVQPRRRRPRSGSLQATEESEDFRIEMI